MTLIVRIFHPIICLIIISSRQENYSITFTLDCPVFTIKTAVPCSTHNNNNIFIPNEIMIIIYNIKDIIIITVYLPSFRIYTIIIVHMSCKGQIYFGSDRQLYCVVSRNYVCRRRASHIMFYASRRKEGKQCTGQEIYIILLLFRCFATEDTNFEFESFPNHN